MVGGDLFAHTPGAGGVWDDLGRHLRAVADRARSFAEPFGGGDVAYWAGLWHDLGKCNPAFQAYLQAQYAGLPATRAPHAIWGAALAYAVAGSDATLWKRVALPIYGHHAGLPHGETISLDLARFRAEQPDALTLAARYLQGLPPVPAIRAVSRSRRREELLIRLLFSALVDADYLDTERHFVPSRRAARLAWRTVADLWRTLDRLGQRSGSINRLHR